MVTGFASYFMNLGDCSVEEAEAWGLLKGLQVAWEKGRKKNEVMTDSKTIIDLFNRQDSREDHQNLASNIMDKCKLHKRQQWDIKAFHIYREQSKVADAIANDVALKT